MAIQFVEVSKLPTPWGEFNIHGFFDDDTQKEHVVLTYGDIGGDAPPLARVHSECLTGDALFSMRCDCGPQLHSAMEKIASEGRGIIFYLRQEGRGIGLMNKIRAYHLQDQGADTVEANVQLGFAADARDYSILHPMLSHLNVTAVRLLTNNPRKVKALQDMGINVVERVQHLAGVNPHNEHYLETKSGKLGHMFSSEAIHNRLLDHDND